MHEAAIQPAGRKLDPRSDSGMGSAHLLGAHGKPMIPLFEEVQLEGNLGLSVGLGKKQAVLHQDPLIGYGMPDEGGSRGFSYLILQTQQRPDLGVSPAQLIEASFVGVFLAGDHRIRKDDRIRPVVGIHDLLHIGNLLVVVKDGDRGGQVRTGGEPDHRDPGGVAHPLDGVLADPHQRIAELQEGVKVSGILSNRVIEDEDIVAHR